MSGEPIVILKTTPADGISLREEFKNITPGYHMNKKNWIALHPQGGLSGPFVDDLVTKLYLLVIENLPQNQRPVDPAIFCQPQWTRVYAASA